MTARGTIRARGIPLADGHIITPPWREPHTDRELERADWLADHEIDVHQDVDALNELAAETARKRAARHARTAV